MLLLQVTIDLQQRCLTIEAPFDTPTGPQQHLLVIFFRCGSSREAPSGREQHQASVQQHCSLQ
jgi:hypothetical protein